jgi:hypothetical protein
MIDDGVVALNTPPRVGGSLTSACVGLRLTTVSCARYRVRIAPRRPPGLAGLFAEEVRHA